MGSLVSLSRPHEGVALVTMHNAEIANCGSSAAIAELHTALREGREGGARVSVLASGVPGVWFQHAWLRDLHALVTGGETSGDAASWFRVLREIADPEVVTIAAISGDCSGGGAELGWACDLRVAEEQALFGQPEVLIGLATGIGGTSRLARLIGPTVTAEMVFDGAPLPARRIYELGGVNRLVAEGHAQAVALDWAQRLASRAPGALAALKRMLQNTLNQPLDEALANEQKLFQGTAFSEDGKAGMATLQARFDAGESVREVYGGPYELPAEARPRREGGE